MSAAMSAVRERFTNCCNWIGSKQDACSSNLLEVKETLWKVSILAGGQTVQLCDPFLYFSEGLHLGGENLSRGFFCFSCQHKLLCQQI